MSLLYPDSVTAFDDEDIVDDGKPHQKLHDSPTHRGSPHYLPDAFVEILKAEVREALLEDRM